MFRQAFLTHPHGVGQSYFAHQRTALAYAGRLIAAGAACAVHGLIPGLFTTTAGSTIAELNERMSGNRTGARPMAADEAMQNAAI